jgi:DNA repair photolyase
MLEILSHERGRSFGVTTKSDLVARDVDLLSAAGQTNNVHVFMTITTTDERLARLLEPYAPRPELRLGAIRKLSEAGVRVVVLACPVMPLINDSTRSLERVASAASQAGAQYMYGNVLFLKPCAQAAFFPFLEAEFPHLLRRYRERYEKNAYLRGSYPDTIRKRMQDVRQKYGLTGKPAEYLPDVPEAGEQLSLWT